MLSRVWMQSFFLCYVFVFIVSSYVTPWRPEAFQYFLQGEQLNGYTGVKLFHLVWSAPCWTDKNWKEKNNSFRDMRPGFWLSCFNMWLYDFGQVADQLLDLSILSVKRRSWISWWIVSFSPEYHDITEGITAVYQSGQPSLCFTWGLKGKGERAQAEVTNTDRRLAWLYYSLPPWTFKSDLLLINLNVFIFKGKIYFKVLS